MGIASMECYICTLRRGDVIHDTEELKARYLVYRQVVSKLNNYKPMNWTYSRPILTSRFCANIFYIYIYIFHVQNKISITCDPGCTQRAST